MRRRLLLAVAVWTCTAAGAWGDSSIVVGDHYLLPDTPDQTIPIYIHGNDQIAGADLVVQVADAFTGPAITWIDMKTNCILDSNTGLGLGDGVIQPYQ